MSWIQINIFYILAAAYVNGTQILLNTNKLTSVDQTAFKPLLNYFKKNNVSAAISLANSTSRMYLVLYLIAKYYYVIAFEFNA